MQAVWWGLATAVFWAAATISSSRAARVLGQWTTVAWVMLVGFVIVLPLVLLDVGGGFGGGVAGSGAAGSGVAGSGVSPSAVSVGTWGLLLVVGLGNVVGLVATYAAFRVGKVGVVAPVVAAEGAVAAVIAGLFGERVAVVVALLLVTIVVGVVIAGVAPDPAPVEHERPVRAVLLAVTAAILFGLGLFANGRIQQAVPVSWVVLSARAVGVGMVTVPLAVARRLTLTKQALPYVLAGGVAEVLGSYAFTLGARESTAVTAVVASQYAPLAALAAFVLFRERLGRLQVLGVGLVVAGVTALSAVGG